MGLLLIKPVELLPFYSGADNPLIWLSDESLRRRLPAACSRRHEGDTSRKTVGC